MNRPRNPSPLNPKSLLRSTIHFVVLHFVCLQPLQNIKLQQLVSNHPSNQRTNERQHKEPRLHTSSFPPISKSCCCCRRIESGTTNTSPEPVSLHCLLHHYHFHVCFCCCVAVCSIFTEFTSQAAQHQQPNRALKTCFYFR